MASSLLNILFAASRAFVWYPLAIRLLSAYYSLAIRLVLRSLSFGHLSVCLPKQRISNWKKEKKTLPICAVQTERERERSPARKQGTANESFTARLTMLILGIVDARGARRIDGDRADR